MDLELLRFWDHQVQPSTQINLDKTEPSLHPREIQPLFCYLVWYFRTVDLSQKIPIISEQFHIKRGRCSKGEVEFSIYLETSPKFVQECANNPVRKHPQLFPHPELPLSIFFWRCFQSGSSEEPNLCRPPGITHGAVTTPGKQTHPKTSSESRSTLDLKNHIHKFQPIVDIWNFWLHPRLLCFVFLECREFIFPLDGDIFSRWERDPSWKSCRQEKIFACWICEPFPEVFHPQTSRSREDFTRKESLVAINNLSNPGRFPVAPHLKFH